MDVIPRPAHPPHRCSFTLRDTDPEGFFQGLVLPGWDPSAAISVSHVKSLAHRLSFVSPEDHAAVVRENAVKAQRIEQLEAEVADLRAKFDAIDVIESEGFRARKKAGRPATTKETV